MLAPFVRPADLDQTVLELRAAAVASVPALDVTFARVAWFGQEVIWLAPDPSEPFRALTSAAWQTFPSFPPYAGRYADVVPHVTIGMNQPADALAKAGRAVQPALPVSARVDAVTVMQGSLEPASWQIVGEFPLG